MENTRASTGPAVSPPALPLKVLLALTAAVLLTHVLLLRASPMRLGLSQPAPARAFITRAIELAPAAPPAVAPIAAPAAPRKRKPPAPVRAATPLSADLPNPSGEAAPPSPPVTDAAEIPRPAPPSSSPEVAAQDATPQNGSAADVDQQAAAPRPPREPASSVNAYAVPGSVRFKYQLETNKFPFSANADLLWQQNGESYDARLEISAFGQARVQTSHGAITPDGLAPLRFSDKYRSEVAAHFNREQGKVTFSANTPDVPLLAGAQDRLSILVQLAAMIAGDPAQFPPATTVTVQTIGPRDADTWLFTVGEMEKLALPGGEQATLKLVRNPRQEFDQKVELWLAPALGYLPARIRITEPNGDFVDQKWLATEPQT